MAEVEREDGWAPCSALDEKTRTCKHGFWVTLACCPNLKADRCFRSKPLIPMCCNEDWCARMFPDTAGVPPIQFAKLRALSPSSMRRAE